MGEVLELAERAWNGGLEETQVHPGTALVGFEELGTGLGFMSAFSNVGLLDTDEGLVFLDTSSFFHAAQLFANVRRWSAKRVHTAVYTHGHVDHVFGLRPFEEEARDKGEAPTRVIAHEACPARFDRYILTNGYNGIINQRQFGFEKPVFPRKYRYPDETLRDSRSIEVGGIEIRLFHDKGETDDHVWAFIPSQNAIYTGDLFIWASPNCGNPQKVQRFPREWAHALRRMAKLGASTLMPGHGPVILGEARVRQALTEAAELLETIIEQTLRLMNEGARLDDVVSGVVMPEELLARPYLRPTYDDPRFIVRNLWRLYGGWYDGNPAHLLPAPERDLARTLAELAGGAASLIARAEREAAEDRLDIACHLVELAAQAEPDNARVHAARARVYRARVQAEMSLMSKGVFGAAARDSEAAAD
ncbi:MAG: alkyl sulfatase dimerization domain-containing protein [Deltaproteobacteria bacterium]